jgi:uncharacterized protein (DUF1697 family)
VRYVALLRGINVGQGARVPMADLKSLIEGLGLRDVATYLNSGNALFSSELGVAELTRLLEGEFESTFGAPIPTLVKTSEEVISIAQAIPSEWGNGEGEQTYVAYLFPDVDEPGLVAELPVRPEFLSIFYTPGAIVWNIKRDDYNRSHITKIAKHSSYARMTTRNVNTARKLAELSSDS